jgi:hypothetical protein
MHVVAQHACKGSSSRRAAFLTALCIATFGGTQARAAVRPCDDAVADRDDSCLNAGRTLAPSTGVSASAVWEVLKLFTEIAHVIWIHMQIHRRIEGGAPGARLHLDRGVERRVRPHSRTHSVP